MTREEALYNQEALMLAYMFVHPSELVESKLTSDHFSFIDTKSLFELMRANYIYNKRECVNAHQIIGGMQKNLRFQNLLDNHELVITVLAPTKDFVVTDAIYRGYLRYALNGNK